MIPRHCRVFQPDIRVHFLHYSHIKFCMLKKIFFYNLYHIFQYPFDWLILLDHLNIFCSISNRQENQGRTYHFLFWSVFFLVSSTLTQPGILDSIKTLEFISADYCIGFWLLWQVFENYYPEYSCPWLCTKALQIQLLIFMLANTPLTKHFPEAQTTK